MEWEEQEGWPKVANAMQNYANAAWQIDRWKRQLQLRFMQRNLPKCQLLTLASHATREDDRATG